jgi:hypothetical protein
MTSIPEQRRRAICDRILDVSHSLADPVPFSVLDCTRSTIIQLVKEGLAAGAFDAEAIECATQTIAQEKAKLNFLPLGLPESTLDACDVQQEAPPNRFRRSAIVPPPRCLRAKRKSGRDYTYQ